MREGQVLKRVCGAAGGLPTPAIKRLGAHAHTGSRVGDNSLGRGWLLAGGALLHPMLCRRQCAALPRPLLLHLGLQDMWGRGWGHNGARVLEGRAFLLLPPQALNPCCYATLPHTHIQHIQRTFSRMYLPSLYFWLSSYATCSRGRMSALGQGVSSQLPQEHGRADCGTVRLRARGTVHQPALPQPMSSKHSRCARHRHVVSIDARTGSCPASLLCTPFGSRLLHLAPPCARTSYFHPSTQLQVMQ